MTIADKINWTIKHLKSRQFDRLTLNDIIEAYLNHNNSTSTEVEDPTKIEDELKACLSRLKKDGYVDEYDFLDEPTYRLRLSVFDIPIYHERTQEEIDREKKEIEDMKAANEYRLKLARDAKRAERFDKFKTVFIKYWFAIVTGLVVAVLTLILDKYFNK